MLSTIVGNSNKMCGRPPRYAPAPGKLTFDLLTLKVHGVRVTCDVGYLCANFSVPIGLCSRLGPMYATDRRQTRQPSVRRQTDVRRALLLNAPGPRGGA